MGDIDSILERLVGDSEFRRQIKEDPAQALAGYDLDSSEREMLVAQLSADDGDDRQVEQRTSKSALGSFLAGLVGGGGSQQSGDQSSSWIRVSQQWSVDPESDPTDQVASQSATRDTELPEPGDPAEDDLSNTMAVSESADGGGESKGPGPNDLKWIRGKLGFESESMEDEVVPAASGESAGEPIVGETTPGDTADTDHDKTIDLLSTSVGSDNTDPDQPIITDGEGQSLGDHLHEGEMEVFGTAFASSDPDQPIIAGRVHNDDESGVEIAGEDARTEKEPAYLEVEMTNVMVTSYQAGGDDSEGAGLGSDGELAQAATDTEPTAASDADGSGAISRKPKEIVVVPSKPSQDQPDQAFSGGSRTSEGIEGTDVSTGYTSEEGDIGDDLPEDPPD